MKFTAAKILVFGVAVTVSGMNADKLSECETFLIGKPDDEDWSTLQNFQGTIEVMLQTGNRDWRKFALGFDSKYKLPIGYLQMEKKGHDIDVTLINWHSSPQNEKQNITGHTRDLFVKWTTITLQRSNGFLHVSVDKVFEGTFTKVNAEPFKFVYAYVPANQYINGTFNCKHGETNVHDQPNQPETVTSIDLSPPTSTRTPESEAGIMTVTVSITVILLVVAAASGGYCFWTKKGCFHTMKDKNRQDDDTEGVNHTLLSQNPKNPNARPIENNTNSIKYESLESISELYNKDPDLKNEVNITEDGTKLEPEEDRINADNSEHLNENQDSENINKTPQTEDSPLHDSERQIIPSKLSITKMDMHCQNNVIDPIPEEKISSVEQVQNLIDQPSLDDVIDAMAELNIEEQINKDNHGIEKDLGNNAEGFPLEKKDPQNGCTSTNKQTTQDSPQNNHPEITNRDFEKIEVHDDPVMPKVVLKLGATEGTTPKRLEEIQNSTIISGTEDDSPRKGHSVF